MIYKYGMRCRPYSIGCQPMENLIDILDDQTGRYWNILEYSTPLNPEQIKHYSLDDLQAPDDIEMLLFNLYKALNKPLRDDLNKYCIELSGLNLGHLIRIFAASNDTDLNNNDFIEYIKDLATNDSIGCMVEYYELIDYMTETTDVLKEV